MKNAYFSLVMALILVFCTLSFEDLSAPAPQAASWTDSGSYAPSFTGGSGTIANPYLISTAAEFGRMGMIAENSLTTQTYFKLIKPIDLTGKTWTPVGTATHVDRLVSLDGNFNSIKGLSVQNVGWGGLFRFVSGTFKNMTFINPFIMNKSAGVIADQLRGTLSKIQVIGGTIISTNDYAGGLVVLADASTIDHCFFRGIIAVTPPVSDSAVSGQYDASSKISISQNTYLAEIFIGRSTIIVSNSLESIKFTQNIENFVVVIGGIAAACLNNSNITNCYFSGDFGTINSVYNQREYIQTFSNVFETINHPVVQVDYELVKNDPHGFSGNLIPVAPSNKRHVYTYECPVNWLLCPTGAQWVSYMSKYNMNSQNKSDSKTMTVAEFESLALTTEASDIKYLTTGSGIAPSGVSNCRFSSPVIVQPNGALLSSDDQIKSNLLSNQYAIDPNINNGFPFLKDFYWQEMA